MSDGTCCSINDCDRPSKVRRMCQMHYFKWWSAQPPSATRGLHACDEENCDRVASRRGLCEKHYRRLMRVENGDQYRATQAAWREANREHHAAVYADWEKRNPEKVSLRDRRNKARRRIVIGSPDPVNYEDILAEHGMTCHICGEPIASFGDLHFDHVIPLGGGHGGAHSAANIRPSHETCNLRKGIKLMSQLSGEVMKTE
jgi:5-methylcytosine-specific restriction endonuclease McrA